MTLKIRKAKQSDKERIVSFFESHEDVSFPLSELSSRIDSGEIDLVLVGMEILAVSSLAQSALKVVYDNNMSAYYDFLDEAEIGERPLYLFEAFHVAKGSESKGIGSLFLKDLTKRHSESDFLLEINETNLKAIRFFLKRGFYRVPAPFCPHLDKGRILLHLPFIPAGLCSKGTW